MRPVYRFPVYDRVGDAGVDSIAGAQSKTIDVFSYHRNLGHEVQGSVQPLNLEVGFQQQDVAGQVDIFGC